jgi:hypothetical protein
LRQTDIYIELISLAEINIFFSVSEALAIGVYKFSSISIEEVVRIKKLLAFFVLTLKESIVELAIFPAIDVEFTP